MEEYAQDIFPKKPKSDPAKASKSFKYAGNTTGVKENSIVMYIDMNSYFASCEQQLNPELRDKPLGVITYDSPNAAVIAASIEAKRMGVKSGMRLMDCKALCPGMITMTTHPYAYRRIHVDIMAILRTYCDDVLAKSIDEAVMNLSSYRLVYKDLPGLARQIKADITAKYDYLKCSVGIAPNSFLAKLGTELQKPDGLIQITPENIDGYLSRLKLTDLPGIAGRNERRLKMVGINTPLEMRHTSPTLLRKAFGGIVGNYWHSRLNFGEVDLYSNNFRTMSATRTVSKEQRESIQSLDSLLIALCSKLEQRMVKQKVFCKDVFFNILYRDHTSWETSIRFAQPVQDGMEMRKYIKDRMQVFETDHKSVLFSNNVLRVGVAIQQFISDSALQYSLFDNRIKHDVVRKTMYNIKDQYGKNSVRKASELFEPRVMKDAIGFGSVKDMGLDNGDIINQYMLEEDY